MSNEYQHLGSDYDFSNERFRPFYMDHGYDWYVEDTHTGDCYPMKNKNHAEDRARAWSYEWDELSLNQFREGC